MTEDEWLACDEPARMLRFLTEDDGFIGHAGVRMATPRQLRLFACACLRQVWHALVNPASRPEVALAERIADGLDAPVDDGRPSGGIGVVGPDASWVANNGGVYARNLGLDWPAQAALLREVAGNPFRAYAADAHRDALYLTGPSGYVLRCPDAREITALARAAYDERLHGGNIDPARLLVLSDALEEAGCADDGILRHLRGEEPHVRGCWALDLVLAKT